MNVDVVTEAIIGRPLSLVAEYAADPGNAPDWYANITRVDWETPPPVAVGSRLAFVAKFLGRTLTYTYEIVTFEPHTRMVMRAAEGPFPMETSYAWEAAGENATRMTLRNRGKPSGFVGLAAPAMALAMRRANTLDLAALKALLES